MPQKFGVPDDENPEWTTEEIRTSKPGADVFSAEFLAAARAERRFRGKQKAPTKRLVSLRVAPDVLDAYRSMGKGWQVLMHDTLAAHAPRRREKVSRRATRASSRPRRRTRAKH